MRNNIKVIIAILALMIISVFAIGCSSKQDGNPSTMSGFGDCLKSKDVKMYGSFWCSHCENMKKNLGDNFKDITYVECSTPDGRGQLPVCKEAGITGYPTVEYNGNLYVGEMSVQELSELVGCQI